MFSLRDREIGRETCRDTTITAGGVKNIGLIHLDAERIYQGGSSARVGVGDLSPRPTRSERGTRASRRGSLRVAGRHVPADARELRRNRIHQLFRDPGLLRPVATS